ncbi:MAG: glucose-6-phosphate isomerase [Cycloclasticus sp.]|nr:glucose-6-phosphate isomerase [Cycloclasticus sp.]MBQ0790867.1 glucose-6-phosphate isomerase [Cycloclasticus sp.]
MASSIKAWVGLQSHAEEMQAIHLKNLFDSNEDRFGTFSFSFSHYLLDLSKQRITDETLSKLLLLADQQGLEAWISKLFNGEKVNYSEQRAALHTALRLPEDAPLRVEGQDVAHDVQASLLKMHGLVEQIQQAQWRGFDGSPIRSVVNIGVGGSNLGPLMACAALEQYAGADIRHLDVHFVSSMDGSELEKLLPSLDPSTTLFIVASKSFATVDTLANANTARQWLLTASHQSIDLINQHHFIAVTARPDQALTWGVPEKNQLLLWDWVGGRYSLWSVVGLPIALKIGMQNFREMLAGAHAMDEHFRCTPFEKNLPVLLALISVWNINFLNIHAHAILPYDGRLAQLPAYLEQLEMESNGKSINRQGDRIEYRTCPVLWGQVGSSAQHAFYQLLHQGTEPVMCDFIASATRYESEAPQLKQQHQLSLANCLAQSRLLAVGDSLSDSKEQGSNYKHYDGNQPSTTIMLDTLTPETLGGLIAMYEHKVFVQSVIWDINPFDQWGVEQGKKAASSLLTALKNGGNDDLDSSTNGLLRYVKDWQQRTES